MVLLEAAAQGLPIVCTDVGGDREVVRPELGGVLTDVDVTAIADGMLRVMAMTPGERAAIGDALRDHVHAGYDMTVVVDRWRAIYADLAGPRPASGMTGTFALTFDTELIWGSFDTLTPERFVGRYPDVRRIIDRTLRMLERYEVAATWAVVGHLFLVLRPRTHRGLAHRGARPAAAALVARRLVRGRPLHRP